HRATLATPAVAGSRQCGRSGQLGCRGILADLFPGRRCPGLPKGWTRCRAALRRGRTRHIGSGRGGRPRIGESGAAWMWLTRLNCSAGRARGGSCTRLAFAIVSDDGPVDDRRGEYPAVTLTVIADDVLGHVAPPVRTDSRKDLEHPGEVGAPQLRSAVAARRHDEDPVRDRIGSSCGARCWDRTSDLFGVNEALSR